MPISVLTDAVEAGSSTVSSFIGDAGAIFQTAVGWVGTVAQTITSNPILLTFTALPLVGLGIGLFKRLLH